MKFLAILGAVFVAQGVLAEEVGTRNLKSAENPEVMELALAEKGAGTSWTEEPLTFQATAHQTATLNNKVEQMNKEVSQSLEDLIAEKVAKALEQ